MQKKDFLQGYSVVIPSNRSFDNIFPLLKCLNKQTIKPFEIIIVYDKDVLEDDFKKYQEKVFSVFKNYKNKNGQKNINIDNFDIKITIVSKYNFKDFKIGKGASYVRNYGIKLVKTKYLLCIDDDNEFNNIFIEELLNNYKDNKSKIIIPTEIYRNTGKIRSMGYIGFNFFLGKPILLNNKNYIDYIKRIFKKNKEKTSKKDFFYNNDLISIKFSSSNCLFGNTELFKKNLFDEQIPFIYEDFIMTSGLSNTCQCCLFVAKNIFINHMMRYKTKIEDLYVSNEFLAYQKGRNRIIFVKKFGREYQKFIYFIVGIWVHTFYLIFIIFISKLKGKKSTLIKKLIKGTFDGLFFNI